MNKRTTDEQIKLLKVYQYWLDRRTYWNKKKNKRNERYCQSKMEEIQRRMKALGEGD